MPKSTSLFNVDTALKQCHNQYELLQSAIESFLQEVDPLLEKMSVARAKGESHEIYTLAHKLLNTLFYLGCPPISELARRLEHAGKANDWPIITTTLAALQPQLQALKTAVQPLRPKPTSQPNANQLP